jgi:hypothetical protein
LTDDDDVGDWRNRAMDAPSRSYSRTKTVEVTEVGDDRYRFVARLHDQGHNANYTTDGVEGTTVSVHHFVATGECEGPDLTLKSLDVEALQHPYADCPFVLPVTRQLIGLPLMSGWRKAVLTHGGGTAGCTHVNSMLLGLGELAPMVIFLRINKSVPQTPDTLADGRWSVQALQVSPNLSGICHGLREGGAALTAAHARLDETAN